MVESLPDDGVDAWACGADELVLAVGKMVVAGPA